jgi:hypothetical protein
MRGWHASIPAACVAVPAGAAHLAGMGTRILVVVLFAVLAAAIYVGYAGWVETEPVEIPTYAYVALGFGTFFTLLVGCGLMALVFYSSRKGYDEPAQRETDRRG